MSQSPGNDAPPSDAPGWYQDAHQAWWWWDGVRWTAQTAYAPQASWSGQGQWAAQQQVALRQKERSSAMLMWVIYIVGGGFISPLIFYFVSKNADPARDQKFVRHHCAEALNMTIVFTVTQIVAFGLMLPDYIDLVTDDVGGYVPGPLFWVGALVLAIIGISNLVIAVIAAVKANRGDWFRIPLPVRLVRGSFKQGHAPYSVGH